MILKQYHLRVSIKQLEKTKRNGIKINNSTFAKKAGNTSYNLWNRTRSIAYSFHQTKEITKKVSNDIIKSIEMLNGYYIHEFKE